MEGLESLLSAAADFSWPDPSPDAATDPLLAVNILTSSAVDAANLQKVLTFLVSSVQSLAASCATSEAAQAAAEEQLASTTEQLATLGKRFDDVAAQVGAVASDQSGAEETASLRAALKESEARSAAQLEALESRLSEGAEKSRSELDAALASAKDAASAELAEAQQVTTAAIEELEKASAAAAASATEGLAASEASTGERLTEVQSNAEAARADSLADIEVLREFVKAGLQAAAEGKEIVTEMPDPGAEAAGSVMKEQLAAATADCAALREQLAAVISQQQVLERGLDPLPASIKELAQIVGSITANTDRAERRSQFLQEQVEDLHTRWNDAGHVIDDAYSRPGSAFSRPGSALDSDGTVSASHSRPGTRELAFPEPDGQMSEIGSRRPRSQQRPQSQHTVARVDEVGEEEEDDDAGSPVRSVTNGTTNATNATEMSHATVEMQEQEQQRQAAVSAAVPDVSQMSAVEQIVVAEVQAEMEAEIAAEADTMPVMLPPTAAPAPAVEGEAADAAPEHDPAAVDKEKVAPVTRVIVAAGKAAAERTGANLERTVGAASATGGRSRRRNGRQQQEPQRDLASIGLQRLMAEVETQAVRLAELESSMKEFSDMPTAVLPLASSPARTPSPIAGSPPPPEPELIMAPPRLPTPTRPATPTGTEMMAAVQARIAASEERMMKTEEEQRAGLKSEIEKLEAELAATMNLQEEFVQQQAGLQAAKDADERLAQQMAALEAQFNGMPAPVVQQVIQQAPAPAPAPAAPLVASAGVDPEALNQMSDALRSQMADQTAALGKSLQSKMYEELDLVKGRLEEVSASIPGQVEAVADGLEDIRRALGGKADAGAIRQLEGIIGQLQQMSEKKQLPGSNSPPMSPSAPPRRYQVPPTITARIISPDLNDIRDAVVAVRQGLSAKADTDKLDVLMKTLGPRMKELGTKLKEVDTLSATLRRNSGAGMEVRAGTPGGLDTRAALEEAVRKMAEDRPDRSETMALSHEISSKNSRQVVNAFREELGAHEERLFNGLCGTFREYAVGLGRLMREELDTLRTHKADRVDIKRLEHSLGIRIAELAANGGGKERRVSTGAVFPSMLAMDIKAGSANENLEDMQSRLEESLGMLRNMYEKEGWGVRSLPPTKAKGGGNKSPNASSTSTNVSFTQFELPNSAAANSTTGPAGLPRPRSTPLSRLGQFDDERGNRAGQSRTAGPPGGSDLGISHSTLGGTSTSFDSSSTGMTGGSSRRSSRMARPGSRGAPARLQPLQR